MGRVIVGQLLRGWSPLAELRETESRPAGHTHRPGKTTADSSTAASHRSAAVSGLRTVTPAIPDGVQGLAKNVLGSNRMERLNLSGVATAPSQGCPCGLWLYWAVE